MKLHHKFFQLNNSIKTRIIFYNTIIIIVIAMFLGIYNFVSYRQDTKNMLISNSMYNTKTVSDRLRIAYDEMLNIVLNSSERRSLFLSLNYKDLQTPSGKRIALLGSQVLNDYCAISGYSEYIASIVLYQEHGLLIKSGYIYGSNSDVPSILSSEWFAKELDKNFNSYHLSLVASPFQEGADTKLLPVARPLKYDVNNEAIDWILLSISTNLYHDILKQFSNGNAIYCITAYGDIIASSNDLQLNDSFVINNIMKASTLHDFFRLNIDGEDCYVTYTKEPQSGIIIYEILPIGSLEIDHSIIILTIITIFILCLIIGLFLSIILSNKISKPISRLLFAIKTISDGDFSYNATIDTPDEIGVIGKHVNQMSQQIATLLHNRVELERERKDLEIRMLQAQINPHFLYNTLDSVRWMAIIQKNTGIVKMITSLSSLLKNMAKGFNEKVTLEKELEFLNDYVTIEKIRYMELFDIDINITNPALYKAELVKLTLQPIIENSIFNGIEPSGHRGLITISAFTENDILYITIQDNGIGMSEEKIHSVMNKEDMKTNSMSGIGLTNVDRRLKLVYGESYGICINSEVGQYTKVTITLPLEFTREV